MQLAGANFSTPSIALHYNRSHEAEQVLNGMVALRIPVPRFISFCVAFRKLAGLRSAYVRPWLRDLALNIALPNRGAPVDPPLP